MSPNALMPFWVQGGTVPQRLGANLILDPSDSANYTLNSGNYEQIINTGSWGGSVDQATSTLRPPQAVDYFGTGMHAVHPDDIDDIMNVTGSWDLWANAGAHTLFFVHYQVDQAHGGFLQMSNGDYLMNNNEHLRIWDATASSSRRIMEQASYTTNTKSLTELAATDPVTGAWSAIKVNGVSVERIGGATTIANDIGSIIDVYSTGSWPAGFRFGEILGWDRELTSGELTAVRNYLNTKWSIY